MSEKKAQGEVRKLLNYLSHLGQRCNITRIAAKHLLIKGKGKSHILNEARSFTYLPIASTGETSICTGKVLAWIRKGQASELPMGGHLQEPPRGVDVGARIGFLSVRRRGQSVILQEVTLFLNSSWALMRIFIERLPEHLRVVLYLAVCDVLILASKNVFEAGGEPLRQTSR